MNTEFVTESCFERCEHDKENPYVMISRAMAQDKSISPKAKGVLLYLLSLPKDWKIYHSQLQSGLDVGEDYVNSAIDELINAGYADRTRERVKGIFQPYKYKIREFKKCSPDRENRPGSAGPEKPVLQSKELESRDVQKKQQQRVCAREPESPQVEQVAAVFLDTAQENKQQTQAAPPPPPKKVAEPKIAITVHPLLEDVDIPEIDKMNITRTYSTEQITHALEWVSKNKKPLIKGLAATIQWACKIQPEIPTPHQDITEINRSYAEKFRGMKNQVATIEVLGTYADIVRIDGFNYAVEYEDPLFIDKFNSFLKKNSFRIQA